jgi:hypothetical protein
MSEDNIVEDEIIFEENKSYKKKQMKEWDAKDVQAFLKDKGFANEIVIKFNNCNGIFLSELKKEDCKELLKDEFQGTFLYNSITNFEKGNFIKVTITKVFFYL